MEAERKSGGFKDMFKPKSEKVLEQKVENLRKVVERNKLRNYGSSIEDVVAAAIKRGVKYKIFY